MFRSTKKEVVQLSKQNAAHILFLSGNDLQTLYNEIEKLCAYTKEGEITKEAIDLNVVRNFETTVFLLANAIVAGNYSKAYELLDILFYQNEEPIAILAVLATSLCRYVSCPRLYTKRTSGIDPVAVF